MNKYPLLLLILLFTFTFSIKAQNKSAGIDLSLWNKLATQPAEDGQTTWLNIGFGSRMNRLHGVGLNIISGAVNQDMKGIQLSGFANIVGGSMRGVQASAIANINGNNLAGASVSGLVNIAGNSSRGVILSGFTNISGDDTRGMAASGLLNLAGESFTGIQVSGLGNVTGGSVTGLSVSGLLNVNGQNFHGVQWAGLLNISAYKLRGIQVSAIGNVVGGSLSGAQIGLCNYVTEGAGLQVGLFNYYRDEFKGLQLGLVNANPRTKVQMMVFGGNNSKINVGARFKNELFYTILGVGAPYFEFDDKFSLSAYYRAGLEIPLYKRLFLSSDLGYQNINTLNNKSEHIPANLCALQARINLEYKVNSRIAIFGTGGYGWTRYYNKSRSFDHKAIVEAGIVLF
ncbi:MAG: hypothetical protein LUE93_06665 [Bacteroides sp.]|nr:hypothetical protein [Bacteroides sp.]